MKIEGLEKVGKATSSWEEGRVDQVLDFDEIEIVADDTFGSDFIRTDEFSRWRGISMHARTQLLRELKIPEGYIAKCPTALRQVQYNYWLDQIEGGEKRLWRSLGDHGPVLGILPSAYADVPYTTISDVLSEVEFDIPMNVFSFDRTPTHLKLVIVGEERLVSLSTERALFPGILIVASDVGACDFVVSDFLFDSACTNGTVLGREIGFTNTIRHKGDAISKVRDTLKVSAQSFPSRLASVPKIVEQAIARVTADGKKMVARLRRFGVAKALAEDIWNEAREEMKTREGLAVRPPQASFWDVTSAMTRLARTEVPDPIQRLKLEQAAGRLLVAV